jgi:hypothetical protein
MAAPQRRRYDMRRIGKKLGAVLAASAIALSVLVVSAPAAQAIHRETQCVAVDSSNGERQFPWCVTININDSNPNLVEALSFSGPATGSGDDPWVRWEWVHLYKNGNVVMQTGSPSAWHRSGFTTADYSTNWFDLADMGANQCQPFYAVARITARWPNGYEVTDRLRSGTRWMGWRSELVPHIPNACD